MNDALYENSVFLIGDVMDAMVSHEFAGVTYIKITVRVNRLTEGKYDDIPVIAPQWAAYGITDGMLIQVTGELRRYKNYNNPWQANCVMVYTKDIEVISEPTCHQNVVEIVGDIKSIYDTRRTPLTGRVITEFLISIARNNGCVEAQRYNVISCIAWHKQAYFVSKLHAGIKVNVLGRLQTRKFKKSHQDGTVTLETVQEISCNFVKVLA